MGTAAGSKVKKDGPTLGKRTRRTPAENTAWLLKRRQEQVESREERRNNPAPPPPPISTTNAAPNPQIAVEEQWKKSNGGWALELTRTESEAKQLAQLDEKHATLRKALSGARLHRPYLNKLTEAEREEVNALLDQRAPSSFSASITPWINRAQYLVNRMRTH